MTAKKTTTTKPAPAAKKPAATKAKTPAKKATKAKTTPATAPVTNAPTPAALSARAKAAPGAIPNGGTDTQVQAMAAGQQLSEAEAYSLNPGDVDNSTLAHVTERFNGVEMTDVPLPRAAALGSQPAVVYSGEAPALAPQPAPTEEVPAPPTPVKDAFGTAADQRAVPPGKRQAAVGMHFANRITRLKMTLHGVEQLPGDDTNPLTRCSFGAVYSQDEATEDSVYGKATPYGSLQYNVRSDLAANMVVGETYFIDIQKVPS